ncbi:hypothetical protein FXO38_24791 [Capsicum annuum]|nr:hypothetical protein FXO37_33205 [Capsicum annuum]KAF3635118.1 hypothetical protein FXO38_24791 [Capsicum annuum]
MDWALAQLFVQPILTRPTSAEPTHSPPLEKTKAELAQVVRQKKVIKEAELVRLPYLHCILKKTLRIHPSVAFLSRKVEQDFELCGYFIPKGSEVIVNILSIGWDPAF